MLRGFLVCCPLGCASRELTDDSFQIEAIYRKALLIHVEVAKETGSGKTGSMMSLETE